MIAGLPWSAASETGRPFWSRSAKAGAGRAPGPQDSTAAPAASFEPAAGDERPNRVSAAPAAMPTAAARREDGQRDAQANPAGAAVSGSIVGR